MPAGTRAQVEVIASLPETTPAPTAEEATAETANIPQDLNITVNIPVTVSEADSARARDKAAQDARLVQFAMTCSQDIQSDACEVAAAATAAAAAARGNGMWAQISQEQVNLSLDAAMAALCLLECMVCEVQYAKSQLHIEQQKSQLQLTPLQAPLKPMQAPRHQTALEPVRGRVKLGTGAKPEASPQPLGAGKVPGGGNVGAAGAVGMQDTDAQGINVQVGIAVVDETGVALQWHVEDKKEDEQVAIQQRCCPAVLRPSSLVWACQTRCVSARVVIMNTPYVAVGVNMSTCARQLTLACHAIIHGDQLQQCRGESKHKRRGAGHFARAARRKPAPVSARVRAYTCGRCTTPPLPCSPHSFCGREAQAQKGQEQYRQEVAALQKDLNSQHMPIALHEEQLANIEREVVQLTAQNVQQERELGLRVQALDDCKRQLHDSESAHQNLNALNAQQERELKLRVRELDESRKELQDSKRVHDEQLAQCASLRVSLEKVELALEDHKRRTQNAEVEVALKAGQIQQLQDQVCMPITPTAHSGHLVQDLSSVLPMRTTAQY